MKKKYTTYIIQNDKGGFYIGYTGNLQKRLTEHKEGRSLWTRRFSSWKLIYEKKFDLKSEAIRWESYLKKQKGGNGLLQIIETAS